MSDNKAEILADAHPSEVSLEFTRNVQSHFDRLAADALRHGTTYHIFVENEIGRGGLSVVYEGSLESGYPESLTHTPVVAKVMLNDAGLDDTYSWMLSGKRFMREALLIDINRRLMQKDPDHADLIEHIPRVLDYGSFLVNDNSRLKQMRYILFQPVDDAVALSTYRLAHPDISLEEVASLTFPIGRVLEWMHGMPYIHRDVKPANILRKSDGSPLLLDFGLGKLPSDIQHNSATAGTPGFVAPEYWLNRDRTMHPRLDGYAFAASVYTLITGHVPYDPSINVGRATRPIKGEDRVKRPKKEPTNDKPFETHWSECIASGLRPISPSSIRPSLFGTSQARTLEDSIMGGLEIFPERRTSLKPILDALEPFYQSFKGGKLK